MSIGKLPESLSRAMLEGTMLVGGLGVTNDEIDCRQTANVCYCVIALLSPIREREREREARLPTNH